ncbi:MAG: hypothetical protein ABIY55_01515 [Kofleriaceae bacterium]
MPIKRIVATPAPGYLIHVCAACGAEHTVSLDRAAQKTKRGPWTLRARDTLTVGVDARPPVTVTFASGELADLGNVTALELAAKLSADLPGVQVREDAGGVLIESATQGDQSRLQILEGTARAALGFPTDGRIDPCVSRPVLGVSLADGELRDHNVIALRRCNDCGANECLVRTFDVAPSALDGTHLLEHRRAVNSLAEHCKDRGWSHPHVIEQHAAEATRPADLHPSFHHEAVDLSRFHPLELGR